MFLTTIYKYISYFNFAEFRTIHIDQ